MVVRENDCCDCASGAYPCLGISCHLRNAPHYYCDECGDEADIYYFEGTELCIDCIKKRLKQVKGDIE